MSLMHFETVLFHSSYSIHRRKLRMAPQRILDLGFPGFPRIIKPRPPEIRKSASPQKFHVVGSSMTCIPSNNRLSNQWT